MTRPPAANVPDYDRRRHADTAVTIRDFERWAGELVDPITAAFVEGGAGDEVTLRDNEAAFGRYRLRPFVGLEGDVDLATTLLGIPVSMPVGIAPSARHGLLDPEGELAVARAAAGAEALYCASSASSQPVEAIAAEAGPAWWFQYYAGIGAGLERAGELGYRAAVLTVDAPVPGHRDREIRAARAQPGHAAHGGGSGYQLAGADLGRRSPRALTWAAIEAAVRDAAVPVVLKGVMTGEDAARSVEAGAAAVWVSNHGGRQLDRVPATLDVLAEVVDAVAGRVEVYVDGGVRRGTDVAIALALGARAVFVGRPVLWGLAVAGEYGARTVLEQVRRETANALALLGAARPAALGRSHVTGAPGAWPVPGGR